MKKIIIYAGLLYSLVLSCTHEQIQKQNIGTSKFDKIEARIVPKNNYVLSGDNYEADISPSSHWVRTDEKILADPRSYCTDLVDHEKPGRHDSQKLAQVIMDIFYERTGPLDGAGLSN